MTLRLAIPSKGRLKEQTEAWLADCGFPVRLDGGERGYRAALGGLDGVEVRLLSAGEIAAALEAGETHLGVTGADMIGELGRDAASRTLELMKLGFGRADLVVAAPKSWIDVETVADLEEVGRLVLARTGRRLRVATKYGVQTREFFARRGVENYRIVESAGATEGAPAAGAAELVVDITTTGATLAANNLKPLSDGLILRSEAVLGAGLSAAFDAEDLARARRLVGGLEARARARTHVVLEWAEGEGGAAPDLGRLGGRRLGGGVLLPQTRVLEAAEAVATAGLGPVTVLRPHYVFETASPAMAALEGALARPGLVSR